MALKKVRSGDIVELQDPYSKKKMKCVIGFIMPTGTSGRMTYLMDGQPEVLYFDKQDLKNMRRLKVSQVPKKLANISRGWKRLANAHKK